MPPNWLLLPQLTAATRCGSCSIACTGFDGVLVKQPDHEFRWRKIGDDTGLKIFRPFAGFSLPLYEQDAFP